MEAVRALALATGLAIVLAVSLAFVMASATVVVWAKAFELHSTSILVRQTRESNCEWHTGSLIGTFPSKRMPNTR